MTTHGERGLGVARAALRLFVLLLFVAPLAFSVSGSLRGLGGAPPAGFEVIPTGAGFAAYRHLADHFPVSIFLRNSLLVVLVAVPVTVLTASWMGFALAQLPRRSRGLLIWLTIAMLMVPVPVLWIPRFIGYLHIGLLDSLVPLMAPAIAGTTPFTVLLAYRSFRKVPIEMFEAARAEGAGAIRTWWKVGLPRVGATTTAIAAIAFTVHWGNYFDALLYIGKESRKTLPLGVGRLASLAPGDLPIMLAGAFVLTVPPLLALMLAQKRLLSSVDSAVAH